MIWGLEWYKWLGIIGVPSFSAAIAHVILIGKRVNILMCAVQASMRHDLIKDHHKYCDRGWLSDEEQKDWEDRYQAYHALGKNGVLDAKREDILKLPNRPQMQSV